MSARGGWVDPYAGQPGPRLFVAVPLPEAATAAVTELVEAVRDQPLPDGMRDVRWVRFDGLHLTLRFLGPTADDRLEPTMRAVREAASTTPKAVGRIGGTGTFPPQGRPRTLWIGLVEGAEVLSGLATAVGTALEGAGWPRDDRPFRPHLTLARTDGLAAGRLVAGRLAEVLGERTIPFDIDRLTLFESVTGGGPARYVPVMEAPLASMR